MSLRGYVYTEGAKVPASDIVDATIDPSVNVIKEAAFNQCIYLTTVDMSVATITEIDSHAFGNCIHLTSIKLPESVTAIKAKAFYRCRSLQTLHLPASITIIEWWAFSFCSSLMSITLPSSLNSISVQAFRHCDSLATIDAPLFPTTIIKNSVNDFKHALVQAGFSPGSLTDLLNGVLTPHGNMYYDTKVWWKPHTYVEDGNGRLPLFIGAERSLKWLDMRQIFVLNMPAIERSDVVTGLEVFMLAASGTFSDLESVYRLLREFPSVVASRC